MGRGPGGKYCHKSLSISAAMVHDGKLYCRKCVPKPKHTSVADDVLTKHQLKAQKHAEESKSSLHKGVYEGKFTTISDDVSTQHAREAHKNVTHSKATLNSGM